MAVTIDDVRHIASLARLGVSDERAAALVHELNTILAHMDVLARVDTTAVEGSGHAGPEALPLRADEGPPAALEHPREEFAPQTRDGFFLVPRLSTHESAGSSS